MLPIVFAVSYVPHAYAAALAAAAAVSQVHNLAACFGSGHVSGAAQKHIRLARTLYALLVSFYSGCLVGHPAKRIDF